jgi:D-glycero-alpha-D-manno-heptose-7-phosphate kinase
VIITRTPIRISLAGGGSDYPAYYEEKGGSVLGFTINRYCWLSLRKLPPFFPHRHRIVYSKVEAVTKAEEILHPVVRAAFLLDPPHTGVELVHTGDLPARSGMGSSSSFTVGLLHALAAFRGHHVSRLNLARWAIEVERDLLGETVGSQDQVWAAYGSSSGVSRIDFRQDGTWDHHSLLIPKDRLGLLNSQLLMFYTGQQRVASDVAKTQVVNFPCRGRHLDRLKGMVDDAAQILQSKDTLERLGTLLHEGWRLKRELAAGVSTPDIDDAYTGAMEAGALGGKLLGAGGGGFLLFFVPKPAQARVRDALSSLLEVPFSIGSEGSKVCLYEPEGL